MPWMATILNRRGSRPSRLDSEATPAVELDEETALKGLTENVRDQDELERDITLQASRALIEAEDKKDQKRIEKAELSRSRLEAQRRTQEQKLRAAHGNPTLKLRTQREIARIDAELEIATKDISDFNARIEQRHQDGISEGWRGKRRPAPQRNPEEFLIRTGKITPFAQVGGPLPDGVEGDLANAIVNAEEEAVAERLEEGEGEGPRSHRNLRLPGFAEDADYASAAVEGEFSLRPRKKRKLRDDTGSSDEFTPVTAGSEPETPDSYSLDDESDDVDLTTRPQKIRRKAPVRRRRRQIRPQRH